MKRLLLAPLCFLLTSCGYSSNYEANIACSKWAEAGGEYTVEYAPGIGTYSIRHCREDGKTNKILGIETKGLKKGKTYDVVETYRLVVKFGGEKSFANKWEDGVIKNQNKVVKHFKY